MTILLRPVLVDPVEMHNRRVASALGNANKQGFVQPLVF
jgi:putative ubiquitin-RnfH superfamily antitoxin RatB of RatAB toxin-antitoxin module